MGGGIHDDDDPWRRGGGGEGSNPATMSRQGSLGSRRLNRKSTIEDEYDHEVYEWKNLYCEYVASYHSDAKENKE